MTLFFKIMDQVYDMITWSNFDKNLSGFSTFISQRSDPLVHHLLSTHQVYLFLSEKEILDFAMYFKSLGIFTSRMQKSSQVNFSHLEFFLSCLFD